MSTLQGQAKRNFVQCFFLAVQERGYFVLNDCFRYISDKPAVAAAAATEENGHAIPGPLADKLAAAVGTLPSVRAPCVPLV